MIDKPARANLYEAALALAAAETEWKLIAAQPGPPSDVEGRSAHDAYIASARMAYDDAVLAYAAALRAEPPVQQPAAPAPKTAAPGA